MSNSTNELPPEFIHRTIAFYLSIYQEKILETGSVTDRVKLLNVTEEEWVGFPSVELAIEYIVQAVDTPFTLSFSQ